MGKCFRISLMAMFVAGFAAWDVARCDEPNLVLSSRYLKGRASVEYSPTGRFLAVAGSVKGPGRGHVTIWDLNQRRVVDRIIGMPAPCDRVLFSPGGDLVAVASEDGAVYIYGFDGSALKPMVRLPSRRRPTFRQRGDAISFSPNGQHFVRTNRRRMDATTAFGSAPYQYDGHVDLGTKAWDLRQAADRSFSESETLTQPALPWAQHGIRFLDNERLVSPGTDPERGRYSPVLFIRNVSDGTVTETIRVGTATTPQFIEIDTAPTASRFAVRADGFIHIYDSTTLKVLRRISVPEGPDGAVAVSTVAMSADGRFVASQVLDSVLLFDAETGQELRSWKRPRDTIVGLVFSPDGSMLAMPSTELSRKLELWAVPTAGGRTVKGE